MGIDILDLTFQVEREFKIRIKQSDWQELFESRFADPLGQPKDLQVRALVLLIQRKLANEAVCSEDKIFEVLKPLIAKCLAVDESEIFLESWFRRDLGME